MNFISVEILGILLNLVSVCLWGLTMLYFVKTKNKSSDDVLRYAENESGKSFDDEVFDQMLKQRSECSLKRISNIIGTEQRALRAQGRNWVVRSANVRGARSIANVALSTHHHKKNKKPRNNENEKDKYQEAVRLADSGMTTRKISEKIKIPKGEIELLVKLRRKKLAGSGLNSASIQVCQ